MHEFAGGFRHFWAVTPTPFAVFFVCWISLGIATSVFYAKGSYKAKKAAHPFIVIGVGIAFLGFVGWLTRGILPWSLASAIVLVLALFIFLNIRHSPFCPRCGATLYTRGFFRPEFCWKCGAKLSPS